MKMKGTSLHVAVFVCSTVTIRHRGCESRHYYSFIITPNLCFHAFLHFKFLLILKLANFYLSLICKPFSHLGLSSC